MGILETIIIYGFAFLFATPYLGMVLVVILTILSPPLAKTKKNANATADQKQRSVTVSDRQHRRRLLQSDQHMHNTHEQSIRMAQDAHDTAVRDAWTMHESADYIAQSAHETAVDDHAFAVDLNDHMVNDSGFGYGTFF